MIPDVAPCTVRFNNVTGESGLKFSVSRLPVNVSSVVPASRRGRKASFGIVKLASPNWSFVLRDFETTVSDQFPSFWRRRRR